eukprot:scaffold4013_cov429-Prasinococcus_capsulatus_cf.AAC.11
MSHALTTSACLHPQFHPEESASTSVNIMAAEGGRAEANGLQQVATGGPVMLAFSLEGKCIASGSGILTSIRLGMPSESAPQASVCLDNSQSKLVDETGLPEACTAKDAGPLFVGMNLVATAMETSCAMVDFDEEDGVQQTPSSLEFAELQVKAIPTQQGKVDIFTRFVGSSDQQAAPVITGLQFAINATLMDVAASPDSPADWFTLRPLMIEGGVDSPIGSPGSALVTTKRAVVLFSGDDEGLVKDNTVVDSDLDDESYHYLLTVVVEKPTELLSAACVTLVDFVATTGFSDDPYTKSSTTADCDTAKQLTGSVADGWLCSTPAQLEAVSSFCGDCVPFCGTQSRDVIVATDECDCIFGMAGDDIIYGLASTDILYGNAGRDTLYGGFSADLIFGGVGDDLLFGGAGKDTLYGQGGADTLFGNNQPDVLFGGKGKDILSGGLGDDILRGNSGPDSLFAGGNNQSDDLGGGKGQDVLYKCNSSNVKITFQGTDTVKKGFSSLC